MSNCDQSMEFARVLERADHDDLDDVFWRAFSGAQRALTVGTEWARRYAPGFSPILAFANPARPDFAQLLPYFALGEHVYCPDWTGQAPTGWRIERDAKMVRMAWARGDAPAAPHIADAVPVEIRHAPQALELALLTNPGPFGLRTIELGDYLGVFEDGRLVAMAGERLHAGRLREVSGICTHPDVRGRGQAMQLTAQVIGRQLARGQVPFLHVMSGNVGARALYERMGFVVYREVVVRIVSRTH